MPGIIDDKWMWMNHFPNLKVGFTNPVTWEKSRGKNAVSAVKFAPLDKILLETDAPYLMPENTDVRCFGIKHMVSPTGKFPILAMQLMLPRGYLI